MTEGPVEIGTNTGVPGLLRLYVAGQSPRSVDAFVNLKAICDEQLPGQYEIEVVDLIEQQGRALDDDVLALPTLLRLRPPPARRIIGDLSDTERVFNVLGHPSTVALSTMIPGTVKL